MIEIKTIVVHEDDISEVLSFLDPEETVTVTFTAPNHYTLRGNICRAMLDFEVKT